MAEHALKDKLRAAVESGSVNLSEQDVAAMAVEKPAYAEKSGDVVVPVSPLAKNDELLNGGADAKQAAQLSKTADLTAEATGSNLLRSELATLETVTVSDEDRAAFLDALITGKRYCRPFELYNGQLRGVLRCRSAEESEAIAAWVSAGIREKRYGTAVDYSLELRNILLAAQVKSIGATEYPTLALPLRRTQAGDKVTPPGWLDQMTQWSTVPEVILGAVYEAIRAFERKYWTMIDNAANQDFWSPVRST